MVIQRQFGYHSVMPERSSYDASFGNVNISDLDFVDDAVIFAETLNILLGGSRGAE